MLEAAFTAGMACSGTSRIQYTEANQFLAVEVVMSDGVEFGALTAAGWFDLAKTAYTIDDPRARQLAALPWRRDNGVLEVLLITSRTNRKWMLPKGWPMDGKSDGEAAAREAFEEAGVQGLVTEAPIGSYAYIKLFDDGSTKPSQAIIYALQVTRQLGEWPEQGERRRKWFTVKGAAKRAFEPDLRRFLTNLAAGRVVLPSATR